MSNVFRGTKNPILQGRRESYSPTNGLVREYDYRGFAEAPMVALAQQWIANGAAVDFQERHGVYSMTAIDTSGQYVIDSWQIAVNFTQPNVFENPVVRATLSLKDRTIIRFAVENGLVPEDAVDTFNKSDALKAMVGGAVAWPASDAANRLYDRVVRGKTEYGSFGYVLRHVTNVGNRYAANISDVNVNRIYTPAQLLSEAQNAGLWIYPLPGRMAFKINTLPAPPVQDGYLWGWLKSASSESTSANFRVDIATEYTLDQWSTDLYFTA